MGRMIQPMQAPRLEEEPVRSVLTPVQHSEMLRALADWIHDLIAERQAVDTSIEWEDGEEILAPGPAVPVDH